MGKKEVGMAPQCNEVAVSWLDEESIKALPVFLVKLLRMLEDPSLDDLIRWDRSGTSFHILDTPKFCDNVLPHYFKHRNLNSFVRQLNFYGFRKLAAADKATLTNIESASDDLHFMHPKFVRGRPNMMYQIKRQTNPTKKLTAVVTRDSSPPSGQEFQNVSITQQEWEDTTSELRDLRVRNDDLQSMVENMDRTQNVLVDEIRILRQMLMKQNDCFNKLMSSLVNMMNPSKKVQRRPRPYVDNSGDNFMVATRNGCDVLACIQREFQEGLHISKKSVFDEDNKNGYFEYYDPESYEDGINTHPLTGPMNRQDAQYAYNNQLVVAHPSSGIGGPSYAVTPLPKRDHHVPTRVILESQQPSTSYSIPPEPVYYYNEEPLEFLEQTSPQLVEKTEPQSDFGEQNDEIVANDLMEFLEEDGMSQNMNDIHGYLHGDSNEHWEATS